MPTEAQQLDRFRRMILLQAGDPLPSPRAVATGPLIVQGVDLETLTVPGPSGETLRVFCLGFDDLGGADAYLGGVP